jgi:RNA polymerase-binding transcription factor DksA
MIDHRAQLESEKERLTEELKKLGKRDPETGEWQAKPEEVDQSDADDNTRADRFEDFEEKSALMTELEARLGQVAEALRKMDEGGYGVCRVCGNPIEEGRLAANPAADTCIEHMDAE